MKRLTRIISAPFPVSLRHTVMSHGWVHLSPFSWNDRTGVLSRPERVDDATLAVVGVSQIDAQTLRMTVRSEVSATPAAERFIARVVRWLCLDWDPVEAVAVAARLSPKIAAFLAAGGGRFLTGSTFYEDYVKTLCTINASWGFTQKMVARMVDDLGGGAFPGPGEILAAGARYFKQQARLGYRSKVLVDTTRVLLKQRIMDEEGNATAATYEALLSLKGIGRYAASHLSVLLRDYSRIPVDSEVRPYCLDAYGLEADAIEPFFAPWGAYRFLGYKLQRIVDRTNWIG